MTKLLEKPEPPTEGECCDSACTPCVWDTYYAARKAWRLQQAKLKEQHDKKEHNKEPNHTNG